MSEASFKEMAEWLRNDLRLKTFPVAAKFLKNKSEIPEKARRPSVALGKRVTVCQGVTMARNYGWTVGLTKEDQICVPAAIMFGFSDSADPPDSLAGLFCEINFSSDAGLARKETSSMNRFENGEIEAIVLAPVEKAPFEPDTVLIYGNPAQMMRLAQAWSYATGERVSGEFGGKVECDESLIAPFKMQRPRMVIPGHGERIFAATQDDEAAFAVPGKNFPEIINGLKEVGKAIGARYPITPYQNFQPELPPAHKKLGKELGIL
ncbi:conserved hypothetical protein [Syntrophobacter sp. SbD1]|nr:conserved hypothetical protein [Syntrophobacter sp. SbD1]